LNALPPTRARSAAVILSSTFSAATMLSVDNCELPSTPDQQPHHNDRSHNDPGGGAHAPDPRTDRVARALKVRRQRIERAMFNEILREQNVSRLSHLSNVVSGFPT
jgi:hypothetical protein